MSVVARAPGKLFLTGEWAVLRGAPALVAAVDREATVGIEPGGDAVEIESLADGRRDRFPLAGPAGSLPGGDAGAVLAVLRLADARPVRVRVDTRAFLLGERKLGLGRSAATLVATATALAPAASRDDVLAQPADALCDFPRAVDALRQL